eukprot:TRINITY_DN2458_c0_g1_i1.p1 TRINITY_DN2458_c0_g1~~TRINITY_DN2458_c0_g1_i1.p1  ORF type:complete len:447 (+),score=73.60 TRINITY_DN2458_c0_g1_i1:65-1405(+)
MIWPVILAAAAIAQLHGFKLKDKLKASTPGTGCVDTETHCATHKFNGACTDQNPQHDHWRTVCAATCGSCQNNPAAAPPLPLAAAVPAPPAAPAPPTLCSAPAGSSPMVAKTGIPDRHLGFTICGNAWKYTHQAERFVKSLVLSLTAKYTKVKPGHNYHLWIFVDDAAEAVLKPAFIQLQHVASRSDDANNQFLNISFLNVRPLDAKYGDTLNLFARCGLVPMVMHEMLPSNVMEMQYFGADQIIVDDLELGWTEAKQMGWDGSKLFGLAEECVVPEGTCGWYYGTPRFKFGRNGLNSGSTLYSLHNMRQQGLTQWLAQAVVKHKGFIALGDQDLMNLYGQEHPDRVSLLQCNFDLRGDSGCDVTKKPPIVLHGNRNSFTNNPDWRAVAEKVDALYQVLECKGQQELPGTSIWDGVGQGLRDGLYRTLAKPWGLSPSSAADLLIHK